MTADSQPSFSLASLPWDELAAPVTLWVVTWVVVGAGFVLLVRRGQDYIRGWRRTSLYFALAALAATWLFRGSLGPAVGTFRAGQLIGLLGSAALLLLTPLCLQQCGRPPEARIRRAPHVYWLRGDVRYAVSKIFEIGFQQVMIVALVRILTDAGLPTRSIILLAVPVFGIVHLPIARLVGGFFGTYYVLFSLLAAVLMPLLILWRPDGYVFSYGLHVLFYLASQMLFWDWSRPER